MTPEFQACLKKGKIQEFSRGKSLVKKELKTAEKDLIRGKNQSISKLLKLHKQQGKIRGTKSHNQSLHLTAIPLRSFASLLARALWLNKISYDDKHTLKQKGGNL